MSDCVTDKETKTVSQQQQPQLTSWLSVWEKAEVQLERQQCQQEGFSLATTLSSFTPHQMTFNGYDQSPPPFFFFLRDTKQEISKDSYCRTSLKQITLEEISSCRGRGSSMEKEGMTLDLWRECLMIFKEQITKHRRGNRLRSLHMQNMQQQVSAGRRGNDIY